MFEKSSEHHINLTSADYRACGLGFTQVNSLAKVRKFTVSDKNLSAVRLADKSDILLS